MFQPTNLGPVLTTLASFPKKYFLENLVMRHDYSMLVTVYNHGELWYLPPDEGKGTLEPSLVHTFKDQPCVSLLETERDVFYVHTSNIFTTHDSALHRLDLREWQPGESVKPQRILDFPEPVRGLNGSCLLTSTVLLFADCLAGLIWRVDLAPDGLSATPRVWLKHENMDFEPQGIMPDQPGVNGIRYAARAGYVYYTSTTQRLFMRVRVDPATQEPAGVPELVSCGRMADDFVLDETEGVAYLATHLQHTIDVVSLTPGENSDVAHHVVVGKPFSDALVGPSSGVWGRRPGQYGRVGYFITDGGTKRPPPDGVIRHATVVRLELNPPDARPA